MARSITKVRIISLQKFEGENDTRYFKMFYLEEPDGKTEKIGAVISMTIGDEQADQVFASGEGFHPLQEVNVEFEIARGGQNKGKNVCLHIEAVAPAGANRAQPQAPVSPKPEQPKA